MVIQNKKDDNNTYELITPWLEEYKSASSEEKRTRLKALIVARMLPIVKRLAHTIARRSYDPIDDLVQAGSIGLLKAIERYSKDINDNFRIYAGYLIIGEMKHYLRDKLNTIKVPRYIQELTIRINAFTSSLTVEQLQELTNDDIAEVLHVPSYQIDYAYTAERRRSTISLDALYTMKTENLNYEEVIADAKCETSIDIEDVKLVLKDVIERLPQACRDVIHMYYTRDMSQKEIADELQITSSAVSRRLKKSFSILHHLISDSENNFLADFIDFDTDYEGA